MERLNECMVATTGWLPARMALAVISWFGFINLYMVRINLSVIIVAMVRRNSSTFTAPCLPPLNTSFYGESVESLTDKTTLPNDGMEGEMEWSETVQGQVLGGFYYGYVFSQIIGGRLAEMYGARWVFGGSILAGGVSAFLSPVSARLHYGVLIAVRAAQGFCQGVSWPSMHALISRWFPPQERPRFVGMVYFATSLSTAVTLPLCGVIIDAYGWPAAFYLTGCFSILWCVCWFTFMYNTPSEHPRISHNELEYITTAAEKSGTCNQRSGWAVPWRRMFSSLPVWAIIISGVGSNWGISLFYSLLPTYIKNILGFSIKANGALSSLPFLSRYVGAIVSSILGDYLTSTGRLSVLASRRIFSVIALMGPAAMLLVVTYIGCNWMATMALMCVCLFCNGAVSASIMVNHVDIAPTLQALSSGSTTRWGV
ncbi:sialin-like [Homarus americanus]|uniref:sialin-like n=1 Tax=Homarus americanus TaxID=6706 RepID=UPI001C47ABE4|nr:sialin-like [Homarus americanus]